MQYRATVEREGKNWNASFVDCPGCLTFGKSEAAALRAAQEALEGWLEASLATGTVPPLAKAKRGHLVTVNPRLSAVVQIRQRRAALGLTQAETARRAAVTQQQSPSSRTQTATQPSLRWTKWPRPSACESSCHSLRRS